MDAKVAWFTGLSGAGKTTIANRVADILGRQGQSILLLDGDDVRDGPHRHLGFGPEDIRTNNRLIVGICRDNLADHDVILVPIISPFRDSRAHARSVLGSSFVEVYVRASLDEVMRRDPKGLYRQVRNDRLPGFIGVAPQVPYEPPESPEVTLDTERHPPEACAEQLVEFLAAASGTERAAAGDTDDHRSQTS